MKYSKDGQETKGFWAGGKFFEGNPGIGILEKQMEDLINARELH